MRWRWQERYIEEGVDSLLRDKTQSSRMGRIWREAGLKPHLVKSCEIPNDPEFKAKVVNIAGLYMNPPDHELVLCANQKSQILALDRTEQGLPSKRRSAGARQR